MLIDPLGVDDLGKQEKHGNRACTGGRLGAEPAPEAGTKILSRQGPSRHRAGTVTGGNRAAIESAPVTVTEPAPGTELAPSRHLRLPSRHRWPGGGNRAGIEPAP